VILFKDLFVRLRQSWRWVAAQFVGTLLLILLGLAWTRLPEKHLWQVALSLLVPLLLVISVLALQAGTLRSLANNDGKRVKMVWGAVTLLLWVAIAWIAWAILDWCDGQIPQWAGYLNSQGSAHARAKLFTYEHIYLWMTCLEWVLRWIVVPAKVIPYAAASAQWGLRLPWRRALHLLWNWRWWLAVAVAAVVAVWLPGRFFTAPPHGTVLAQEGRVALKLAASYLLSVGSWVLLLAWAAVLFGRQEPLPENEDAAELFKRLYKSRRCIWAQFSWVLLWIVVSCTQRFFTGQNGWQAILSVVLGGLLVVLAVAALIVQAGTLRSLLSDGGKRVRMVWGTLAMLIWAILGLIIAILLGLWYTPFAPLVLGWVVTPAILLPFAAASAMWGLRLPWRKVLRLLGNWRWWLSVLLAAIAWALVELISNHIFSTQTWSTALVMYAAYLFEVGIWVLLLGWLAVLFDRQPSPKEEQLLSLGIAGLEDKNK
jgi:hypothetical protein